MSKKYYEGEIKVNWHDKQLNILLDMSTVVEETGEYVETIDIIAVIDIINNQEWTKDDITLNESSLSDKIETVFENIEFYPKNMEGEDDESWKYEEWAM